MIASLRRCEPSESVKDLLHALTCGNAESLNARTVALHRHNALTCDVRAIRRHPRPTSSSAFLGRSACDGPSAITLRGLESTLKAERGRPVRKFATSESARMLRCFHGMRPEQWQAMFDAQGGNCYLCGLPLPESGVKVAIDHDHSCCQPPYSCAYCRRGLAHTDCNTAIGLMGDDPERVHKVAANLEQAQARTRALMAAKPEQCELTVDAP